MGSPRERAKTGMEYDRIRLGYVERFRELIKEYAQLGDLGSDSWSEDNPRIRVRKELNALARPVSDALAAVGVPFTLRLEQYGRAFDIDLTSELYQLPH